MLEILQTLRRQYAYGTRQYAALDLAISEFIGAGDRNCDIATARYLEARKLLDPNGNAALARYMEARETLTNALEERE